MLVTRWIRKSSVGLLSLGLLISVSGCWSAPDAQTSAMYGAAQGATIGSMFGCSSAYNFSSRHHEATAFAIGCPVGLVTGAVSRRRRRLCYVWSAAEAVGAAGKEKAGYLECQPEPG